MKTASTTIQTEKLLKHCVICGKNINVILYPDGKYKGGNYFFKMKVKGKQAKYWECDKCFKNQS